MLLRAIVQGVPGSGKTPLMASAANAGYRIVLCDFDHCAESLIAFTEPDKRSNLHIIPFDDGERYDPTDGIVHEPKAMQAFNRFLYHGTPELGKPSEWGPETILVLDTLTKLGEAALLREVTLNPKADGRMQMWQAGKDEKAACQAMLSPRIKCHVVVTAHLRLCAPQAESGYLDRAGQFRGQDTSLQRQVKAEKAQLQETGYFPEVHTEGVARNFISCFPFALLCEVDDNAKHASKRVVRTQPVAGYQIKCPIPGIADKLPIETALTTLLSKLPA